MRAPQDLFIGTTSNVHQSRFFGFLSPEGMTVLLAAIFCVTFYAFGSNTLNGDGLRCLPALRTITEGPLTTFEPKPWLEIYRSHYDRVAAHHHMLFGITVRAAFALQQALRIPGDAIIAIRAVNALSAAIAGALFFLLALRVGVSKWYSLAIAVGLCLSPAYLYAATNLAEVGLALPFFVGTLLLLANRPFVGWTPAAAGILLGLAAISYMLAGALVPCMVVAIIATRLPSQSVTRPLLFFLSAFALVFLGIWVTILMGSGLHTPDRLLHAILHFPEQGTYGRLRLGSLIGTPLGLTQSFVPILPEDFLGLRSLYHHGLWPLLYVGAASLMVCVLLVGMIYALFKQRMQSSPLVLSALLTFFLVESVCMWWDPYYVKLQIFGVILFWVISAVVVSGSRNGISHGLLPLFIAAVLASGTWTLRNNLKPSQARANAQQLHSIVGNGLIITGWAADTAHLWLFSNGDNIIPIPDFALARNLRSETVQKDMETIIARTTAHGGRVYFYGIFDENDGVTTDVYETRFRLVGFTDYLRGLQRKAQLVTKLPQPGGHSLLLYVYVP